MSEVALGLTVGQWVGIGAILAVVIALFVAMRRVQRVLVRRVMVRDYTADMIRRILMALITVFAGIYILGVLQVEIGPLIGGLGISGLIVAVALQPLFANFVGSILLHGTRAFRPGDEITTNGISGTVVDISHRAVEIRDFDGNSAYVPNMRALDGNLVQPRSRKRWSGIAVTWTSGGRHPRVRPTIRPRWSGSGSWTSGCARTVWGRGRCQVNNALRLGARSCGPGCLALAA